MLSALIIFLVILFLAPLFQPLPLFVLASIIAVALKGILFQVTDFFKLLKLNKLEALTWLTTFLSVVLFDVDVGLALGFGVSLLLVVLRDNRVQIRPLKMMLNSTTFLDEALVVRRTADEVEQENVSSAQVKIFKLQNSLYFVNSENFIKEIYNMYGYKTLLDVQETNNHNKQHENLLTKQLVLPNMILDLSACNYIDTNGVKALEKLVNDFNKLNVFVYLCGLQGMLYVDVSPIDDQKIHVNDGRFFQ